MQEDNFIYKTQCELSIVSDNIESGMIVKKLDIQPSRLFHKGEKSISPSSGSVIEKPYHLCAYSSEISVSNEESISEHIKHFQLLFRNKMEILREYVQSSDYNVVFWIWLETDNAGYGLDLNKKELDFIHQISQQLHVSFVSNLELTE